MFGWFKRRPPTPSPADSIPATQPPMQPFPWPRGAVITAVDEPVLALPLALIDKDRPIGEFLFAPDHLQINIPPDGDTFFIRLAPGTSVSLAKSCESYIVADDKTPRRLKVNRPPTTATPTPPGGDRSDNPGAS